MDRTGKTIRQGLAKIYAEMQDLRGVDGDIEPVLSVELEEAQEQLIRVVESWARASWGTVDVFSIKKGDRVILPPDTHAVCCNYTVDISGLKGVVIRNDYRLNEDDTPDEDTGCHIKLDVRIGDFDEWENVIQFGEGGTPAEELEGVEVLTDIISVDELLEMTPIAIEGYFNRYFPCPSDKSHYVDFPIEIYTADSDLIKGNFCESCGTNERDKSFYIGTDDPSDPIWCEEHYAEINKDSEFHKLKPEEEEEKEIRERLEALGWYYGVTGGNCDGYFYDIDEKENTHYLMTDGMSGVTVPTRRTSKVYIGVYGDKENACYNATGLTCKLEDILSERIVFHKT